MRTCIRGAQPLDWLRDPDPAQYRRWLNTGVIQPGADADIILVDSSFGLKAVPLGGKRGTYP